MVSGRRLISVLVIFLVIPPLSTYFLPLEFLLPLVLTQDPGCFHPDIEAPLVPAKLTIFPCPECDGAVLVLDAAVGHIVAALDGSPEECSAGGTDLASVITVASRHLTAHLTRPHLGHQAHSDAHCIPNTNGIGFEPFRRFCKRHLHLQDENKTQYFRLRLHDSYCKALTAL